MSIADRLARFQAILEGFDGYIYVCSRDYRVEYMNDNLIRRTGYDGTGRLCYEVLHNRDSVCPWCVNERVFAGETVRWEIQSPKDGRWFYVINTPVRLAGDTVSKQSLFVDITDRKRLESELVDARDRLETRVRERTQELEQTNRSLAREVRKRKRAEKALRESERVLRRLSGHLLRAQETERRRLSVELHDEMGQALTVLKLRVRAIARKLPGEEPLLREECERMMDYADELIERVRRLSMDLSPPALEDLGLSAAVRNLVEEYVPHFHVVLESNLSVLDGFTAPEARILVYRILQEAFTNIARHAEARTVRFGVRRTRRGVMLRIVDDGVGFDPRAAIAKAPGRRGLGLTAMGERVRMLGGRLAVAGGPGCGTRLTLSLPVSDES